jgi:dolichol kinase
MALTVWTYLPAVRADFVFDDVTSVIENPALHWESLSWDAFRGLTESVRLPRRIVANFTFALNHLAGGLDPGGYHLFNILVHLGVGAALALFIWLYLRSEPKPQDRWTKLLAVTLPSALFLVHPLNTQAVTYVVQRMASLATLFVLLSMAMYLAARTRALRGPKTLWYALSALFLALGLGTKETAAIVPLVLLTYEWCFHRAAWRSRFRQIWSASAPKRLALVVLAVSIAGLATAGLLAWVGGNPFQLSEPWLGRDFNGIERVLTQTRAHWLYLSLLVWPAPGRLNLDHDFGVSRGLLQPSSTLFASIGLVLLVGMALYLSFKRPRVGFPLLAYFEFHALESGPVNLELVFEHRMYSRAGLRARGRGGVRGATGRGDARQKRDVVGSRGARLRHRAEVAVEAASTYEPWRRLSKGRPLRRGGDRLSPGARPGPA